VCRKRPPLTVEQILAWADAHHARTGRWPSAEAGPVPGAPGETWHAVHAALYVGRRGLPGGDSLARLLARHQRSQRRAPPGPKGRPWTPEEDELARTLPPEEVARRTRRSRTAVYVRRYVLGVSPSRRRQA
jgi:hypothetical protein